MHIGVSTSCFYPMETEKALLTLAESGVKTAEIFFNSHSEITGSVIREIMAIKENYGITVNSVHPYLSFGETYLVFSEYYRRFLDSAEEFKRFFDTASKLGSHICVFHGEKFPYRITPEAYIERVGILSEAAKAQGVMLTQENVVNFRSQSLDFLQQMKDELGDLFHLTFDIKQAVRSKVSPLELAQKFSESIVNVHISDHTAEHDCLPPLCGEFDFASLFEIMQKSDYCGNYIVELYSSNFKTVAELMKSYKNIAELFNKTCNIKKI